VLNKKATKRRKTIYIAQHNKPLIRYNQAEEPTTTPQLPGTRGVGKPKKSSLQRGLRKDHLPLPKRGGGVDFASFTLLREACWRFFSLVSFPGT
jgi:hypothetical protein